MTLTWHFMTLLFSFIQKKKKKIWKGCTEVWFPVGWRLLREAFLLLNMFIHWSVRVKASWHLFLFAPSSTLTNLLAAQAVKLILNQLSCEAGAHKSVIRFRWHCLVNNESHFLIQIQISYRCVCVWGGDHPAGRKELIKLPSVVRKLWMFDSSHQMMMGMSTPVPASFCCTGASECHTHSGVFPQRGPFTHIYRDGGRAITTRRASFKAANVTAAPQGCQRKWKKTVGVVSVYLKRKKKNEKKTTCAQVKPCCNILNRINVHKKGEGLKAWCNIFPHHSVIYLLPIYLLWACTNWYYYRL